MPRKLSEEGKDFNKLRGMGYEFKSPQDEYSYQPDSGSAMGGREGKQEYGIDSSLDSGGKRGIREAKTRTVETPVQNVSAILKDDFPVDINADLLAYIVERLSNHPELKNKVIKIKTERDGSLTVDGVVTKESDKIRVSEFIEAIVPNTELHNHLEVAIPV